MSNILIIGPAWVGDMVMAQSLFKLLKQSDPLVQIDVIAPKPLLPLLERMPEIQETIISPLQHGKFEPWTYYTLGKTLRKKGYTQAIVLPNSWKSALIPFFAKIPIRTGWIGECRYGLLNDIRTLDTKRYPKMVERFMALGLHKNQLDPTFIKNLRPQLTTTKETIDLTVQRHQLNLSDTPILALCPGAAFGPSKCWPEKYFAEIANIYLNQNGQVWLFGSKNDEKTSQLIQSLTHNRCTDLTGKTTLSEAIDLLSLANLVIANDSGLMHIAAALNRPVVAIYGATTEKFAPPLSEQAKTVSIDLDCRPCFKRECPLKHHRCMIDLKPEYVLKAMEQVIS